MFGSLYLDINDRMQQMWTSVPQRLFFCRTSSQISNRDICLISLSSVGMQQLLSICDIYAKEHDLLYNGGKSYSLCFKPICSRFNRPTFTLNH